MPPPLLRILLPTIGIILAIPSVEAQVVTASFDNSIIGENPASAATRDFGIVSPFVSMTKIEHALQDQATGTPINVKREIDMQRYEFVFAGKGSRYVPEIYLSQNQGEVSIVTEDGTQASKNDISLFNNQFNLGISQSSSLKLGVSVFNPQVAFEYSNSYNSGGQSQTNSGVSDSNTLGISAGFTYFIVKRLAFGGFYTWINEKFDDTGSVQMGSDPEESYGGKFSDTHKKYGVGLSYKIGSPKSKGFRIEVSHCRMRWDGFDYSQTGAMADSQNRLSLEVTTLGLTGGVTYTRSFGKYVNYRYFLDAITTELRSSQEPVDSIGGFLGFKSSGGSTFGAFATYFKGEALVTFSGADTIAEVKQYSVGVNYAYIF